MKNLRKKYLLKTKKAFLLSALFLRWGELALSQSANPNPAASVAAATSTAPTSNAPQVQVATKIAWTSEVPAEGRDPQPWVDFLGRLQEKDFAFSAIAVASRMLLFFQDLPTKEKAFKAVIKWIDRGYPYPVQNLFAAGDLTPRDQYDFANSYNLYKAIAHQQKGMSRWADNYFSQVDKENFPKYLFYQALEAYARKDFAKSEELIKKILAKNPATSDLPFFRKVIRTLARIYFEQQKYEDSLDIYQTFLLKLNPMTPSDWLEAAWNLYHLKRPEEALGYLYNLER